MSDNKYRTEAPEKVYVGNARIGEFSGHLTINISEVMSHADSFRKATVGGKVTLFLDVTLLPFKDGKNRFGNTHYIILKNK